MIEPVIAVCDGAGREFCGGAQRSVRRHAVCIAAPGIVTLVAATAAPAAVWCGGGAQSGKGVSVRVQVCLPHCMGVRPPAVAGTTASACTAICHVARRRS